jgi:hypothetical protein
VSEVFQAIGEKPGKSKKTSFQQEDEASKGDGSHQKAFADFRKSLKLCL